MNNFARTGDQFDWKMLFWKMVTMCDIKSDKTSRWTQIQIKSISCNQFKLSWSLSLYLSLAECVCASFFCSYEKKCREKELLTRNQYTASWLMNEITCVYRIVFMYLSDARVKLIYTVSHSSNTVNLKHKQNTSQFRTIFI